MREYGIELRKKRMSWRQFIVHLTNMSSESVYYYILNKETEDIQNTIENPVDIAQDIARTIAARKK